MQWLMKQHETWRKTFGGELLRSMSRNVAGQDLLPQSSSVAFDSIHCARMPDSQTDRPTRRTINQSIAWIEAWIEECQVLYTLTC